MDSNFDYRLVYEIVFLLFKPLLKDDLPLDNEGILLKIVGPNCRVKKDEN